MDPEIPRSEPEPEAESRPPARTALPPDPAPPPSRPPTAGPAAPAFFAVLRDPAAPDPAKDAAWAEFVLWFHAEHYRPELEARLERRIAARGLAAHFAAGDVLTRFCMKVRRRPEVLGRREVPSRAWLRQQLGYACQDLEKVARREEGRRLRPGDPAALEDLLGGSTTDLPAHSQAFSAAFLTSPEVVVLMRELEVELGAQLVRLRGEHPAQHDAWVLGTDGTAYAAIGRVLGTTVGTVKSLVHRAREKLRDRLRAYLGAPAGEGRK